MVGTELSLPPEVDLAIAHTLPPHRAMVRAMLEFDRTLARGVAQASEPITGQFRLAWWRDALSSPVAQRPTGNPLLDTIGVEFGHGSSAFAPLVDGWEALLLSDNLDHGDLRPLVEAREQAWLFLAACMGPFSGIEESIRAAARNWALGDLLAGLRDDGARERLARSFAQSSAPAARLPRHLRGLAILAALGRRSVERGGAPMIGDRGSALTALRAVLFGR